MKKPVFAKRTHPENRRKVNNGRAKSGFFWGLSNVSKCPERTHSNQVKLNQTESSQIKPD
jgi:hypothetical protein